MRKISVILIFSFCLNLYSQKVDMVNIAIPSPPRTFIPNKLIDLISFNVAKYIHEPIFYHDDEDSFSSHVLEKWRVSKDKKKYFFTLKKGVLFHNLKEADAYDAVYSILECKKVKSCALSYVSSVNKIKVDSKYSFSITLKMPNVSLLFSLSDEMMALIPNNSLKTRNKIPVGAGPYMIHSIKDDDEYILSKFNRYVIHDMNRSEKIRYKVVTDIQSLYKEHGKQSFHEINHLFPVFNMKDLRPFLLKYRFKKIVFPSLETNLIYMNNSINIFKDKKIRQFFFHFFRQPTFTNILSSGEHFKKATGLISYGMAGHAISDINKNLNILSLYNKLKLKKNISLDLITYLGLEKSKNIQKLIDGLLPKNSKIKINVLHLEKKEYYTKLFSRDYGLAICVWVPDYTHPFFYIKAFQKNNEYNFGNVNDLFIDNVIENSYKKSSNQLIELSMFLDNYIMKNYYLIPISYNKGEYYYPENISKYSLSVLGVTSFDISHIEVANN